MNTLVVDDDKEIVESISLFLQAEGLRSIRLMMGLKR